jgi:hypothetical protein
MTVDIYDLSWPDKEPCQGKGLAAGTDCLCYPGWTRMTDIFFAEERTNCYYPERLFQVLCLCTFSLPSHTNALLQVGHGALLLALILHVFFAVGSLYVAARMRHLEKNATARHAQALCSKGLWQTFRGMIHNNVPMGHLSSRGLLTSLLVQMPLGVTFHRCNPIPHTHRQRKRAQHPHLHTPIYTPPSAHSHDTPAVSTWQSLDCTWAAI